MKTQLFKIYRNLMMEQAPLSLLPKMIRKSLERILFFILYPEFRRNLNLLGFLSWGAFSFVSYLIFALLVNNYVLFNKTANAEQNLNTAYKKIEFLNTNAKTFMYHEAMDSMKTSAEYMRYQIFQKTGITVPEKVSREHLLVISETSKEKQIPLSIYLRLVNQESGFDSSAVNPTSGALGYMQLLPSTFRHLKGVLVLEGGNTAINNLLCGSEYLKTEFAFWIKRKQNAKEAWEMSLACYTMGDSLPRAINKVPEGVKYYVDNIMKGYKED